MNINSSSNKQGYFSLLYLILLVTSFVSMASAAGNPSGGTLKIGNHLAGSGNTSLQAPYFYGVFDAAGFSDDGIYYGKSPTHDYAYHELLSGEWAAAVYYDGISTDPVDSQNPNGPKKAMWLTDLFVFPNWQTNSLFEIKQSPQAWQDDDTNGNPSPMMDTGKSIIDNSDIEVTIDYEVVDLAFADPNSLRSPMSFYDPNTQQYQYANSDRYIILQTYTIRNLDPNETITGIEFYQMLHSHGADEYNAAVNSTYSTIPFKDPLEYYVPYNSIHCAPGSNTVGNFRFDITQWNDINAPAASVYHSDWAGFSCAVEPDWIDSDVYRGGHYYDPLYKPSVGTHINIEKRSLNGVTEIFEDEVAGAMGWSLGTLDPNETVSITIAFMFGHGDPNPLSDVININKYDDVDGCVSPYDANEITYTIEYSLDPDFPFDVNDVVITDYLPAGVDYPVSYTLVGFDVISSDPNYDNTAHTYTWDIGTLIPGDSGTLTLTVYVNEKANPYDDLYNQAILSSSIGSVMSDEYTDVCGWNPPDNPDGIIYVDKDAKGYNTGVRWKDAYVDLQSGLARARKQTDSEIWVAEGTYYPTDTTDTSVSFDLVDDGEVYGGFKGNETARSQRDFTIYKTVLSGEITPLQNDPNFDSYAVVTAVNGITDSTVLDGFVVTGAKHAGIYLYDQDVMDQIADPNAPTPTCDISPNILNCFVTANDGDGIHGQLADPNIIYACIIAGNGGYGIIDANSTEVVIDRCVIRDNGLAGIEAHIADSGYITNCFIYKNAEGVLCYGESATGAIDLRNNTIVYNDGAGIIAAGGDDIPVLNSILWGNESVYQMYDCEPDYCFIDSNSIIGTTNFFTDPGFAYTEPNTCNYHLAQDSNCIDEGLTVGIPTSEKDIDGEERIYNSLVDIGADEFTDCNDVFNEKDHNGDGIVNLIDFNLLSASWMTYDPCSPPNTGDPNFLDDFNPANYDSRCDYDDDGMVYLTDLDAFAGQWLWEACWRIAARGSWLEVASTGSSQLAVTGLPSAATSMSMSMSMPLSMPMSLPMGAPMQMSAATTAVTPEPSPAEQLLQAQDMIDFLNMIYKDEIKGNIDKKTWNEFMDHLEGWVDSLAEDYLNSTE